MNPQEIEAAILLQNNTPIEDFCGLTANEMHRLPYNPFGVESPLRLRYDIDDATLDRIPFFRLSEELLKIIRRDKSIRLTGLGALPRKTLQELYDHKFITEGLIEDGFMKLSREQHSVALTSVHINTEFTTLVKKSKGKLTLTKNGQQLLLAENRQELFRAILSTFTLSFAWSHNDRYPQFPVGQYGWGFSVYLVHKFGDKEQTVQFYADKYLRGFPQLLEYFAPHEYSSPLKDFTSCYGVRTFDRFLEWFGFATIQHSREILKSHDNKVTRPDLLDKVMYFD